VRWENKLYLIAYPLGSIYAKNCCNRAVYVNTIESQRWDVFWDTVYNQQTTVRSVHMCMHCTVYNCCTQYCTEHT